MYHTKKAVVLLEQWMNGVLYYHATNQMKLNAFIIIFPDFF